MVNTCPLVRPSRLSLARISILSPELTSICREQATSKESGRCKSSVISFLEAMATMTFLFSTRTTVAEGARRLRWGAKVTTCPGS